MTPDLDALREQVATAAHRRICEGAREWCIDDHGDCERVAAVVVPIVEAALLDAAEESDALRAELLACKAAARGYREAAERRGDERDDLLAIIDDARHALSADGPKLEPARQVLARALPQITAWQDRTRHARDNTPPHVIAHRGAQLDAVTAERDALAAAVERVRALPAKHPAGGWYMTSMRDVLAALDGEARP